MSHRSRGFLQDVDNVYLLAHSEDVGWQSLYDFSAVLPRPVLYDTGRSERNIHSPHYRRGTTDRHDPGLE